MLYRGIKNTKHPKSSQKMNNFAIYFCDMLGWSCKGFGERYKRNFQELIGMLNIKEIRVI